MTSKPSGAQNRKRKANTLQDQKASAILMSKFLARDNNIHSIIEIDEQSKTCSENVVVSVSESVNDKIEFESDTKTEFTKEDCENCEIRLSSENINTNRTVNYVVNESDNLSEQCDFSDIGQWPILTPAIRDQIIKHGPKEILGPDSRFPIDISSNTDTKSKSQRNRRFSIYYCTRKLPNNEKSCRSWLQYSDTKNRVFCYCCKLFDHHSHSKLGNDGSNNWKHIGEYLKQHETSSNHFICYNKWRDSERNLNNNTGIDGKLQSLMQKETDQWKAVLERLIALTIYLAKNNLAFRGGKDKLYARNNGNFLGLVELLGKYDSVIAEHLRRIQSKEIHDHYLGKSIQNELIQLLGNKVKETIVSRAKQSKYFSVILDCTPDVSHTEQMSFTVRFLDTTGEDVHVKEHFISFCPVFSSTGENLTTVLLEELQNKCGLDMENCRGQGYDNGANMAGNKKGVQRRLLEMFPRAFFNPCGCHSLNLLVCDAAKSSVKSISLFGILQRLFVLFSASPKRWKILQDSAINLSVKQVCETRWECRIQSLKAVRYQFKIICDALSTLQDEVDDSKVASEAQSLENHLCSFDFIITLVVWYDVLFQINIVSKIMQSKDMDLPTAIALLKRCEEYLKEYRVSGYVSAVMTAKEISEELGIDPVFKETHPRKKKRQFQYEGKDETPTDPEDLFKTSVFYPMLDNAISSIRERFIQLNEHREKWSFLYDIHQMSDKNDLKQKCNALHELLQVGNEGDIDGQQLCDELLHLQPQLLLQVGDKASPLLDSKTVNIKTPLQILNHIHKNNLADCFPNVWIALRILLTIPITVASGERSFSKLKLIKTYLRSTMLQERLSALASIAIENEVVESLDLRDIIHMFAENKARRGKFI